MLALMWIVLRVIAAPPRGEPLLLFMAASLALSLCSPSIQLVTLGYSFPTSCSNFKRAILVPGQPIRVGDMLSSFPPVPPNQDKWQAWPLPILFCAAFVNFSDLSCCHSAACPVGPDSHCMLGYLLVSHGQGVPHCLIQYGRHNRLSHNLSIPWLSGKS